MRPSKQFSPDKVVCLSTIGAQASQENLLTQLQIMEQGLGRLPMPIVFLRAAWFMENAAGDVEPAVKAGVIQSFLQPLDKPVSDGCHGGYRPVAAELLQERATARKVIELEGPRRVTPNDLAAAFSKALDRTIRAEAIHRDKWEALFNAQGMLTRFLACECSMASTKDGSSSRAARRVHAKARFLSTPSSANS